MRATGEDEANRLSPLTNWYDYDPNPHWSPVTPLAWLNYNTHWSNITREHKKTNKQNENSCRVGWWKRKAKIYQLLNVEILWRKMRIARITGRRQLDWRKYFVDAMFTKSKKILNFKVVEQEEERNKNTRKRREGKNGSEDPGPEITDQTFCRTHFTAYDSLRGKLHSCDRCMSSSVSSKLHKKTIMLLTAVYDRNYARPLRDTLCQ